MDSNASKATQTLGRRERNKQRVKERLYTSALTLFTEHGYDQTSIDEIAELADVARGTFFNYFQRKEDLISAWGEQRRARLAACLKEHEPASGSGCSARLEQCMCALARINEEEADLTAAMLTAWVKAGRPLLEEPYVTEIFADIVKTGREQGEIVPEADPEHVGNILRDIYLGALFRWSRQQPEVRPGALDRELRTALKLLIHGISTQPQPELRRT
ncbi:TetR/AcrR family transcriptional regulator [Streptomyces sp. RB6PN25]|uniref:TetR/AcrR family transcriptional regulator n=1 Tax=Streptomyces humicola TaxID=2953240 RepID=A0ABT1PT85_9ACTN|nr:TetR/AcrR family transcriptional regulator [Streptomyces humicola]MCQ4079762.1 TetR/AcrR family transcriptional regulator [Streptomyces humicola]